MSVSELAEALGMEKGGKLSAALGQLCEAGFVALDAGRNPETGAKLLLGFLSTGEFPSDATIAARYVPDETFPRR